MWGEVRGDGGKCVGVLVEVRKNVGKCRGSCWESSGRVYGVSVGEGVKKCEGRLFEKKCLGLHYNISIVLALQLIVAIPN